MNKKLNENILLIFIKDLYCRLLDDDIMGSSSSLAYALLISFFPFIIFLLTIIGFLPIGSNEALSYLERVLPQSAYKLVYEIIDEILSNSSINLLSFSILITLYTSSRGFRSVIKGLNRAYDEKETRSFIRVELISILCTIGIIFILVTSLMFQVFFLQINELLIKYFKYTKILEYTSLFNKYLLLSLSIVCTFAFIYKYTPNRKIKWLSVFPGAIFSTLGWVLSSLLFSFYVNNFSNYSRLYGSIAALFILLTWLFISSNIVLLGGEINATISFIKENKKKPLCKKY